MNREVRMVRAMDVFARTVRFEWPVKFAYIHSTIENDSESKRIAQIAYLELMRAANDFFEDKPRKMSIGDFLSAFDSLIGSMQKNGFDANNPVAVDVNGETMNGQHRTAIAGVLGLDIPIYLDKENIGGMMSAQRFKKRGCAKAVMHYCVRQYFRFNERARLIRSREQMPKGAFVWFEGNGYSVISFPDGVPEDFAQSLAEARTLAQRIFPDKGFPDWHRRAVLMRIFEPWRALRRLRYRILSHFRKGARREKALFHVFELARRQQGYEALAGFAKGTEPSS